MSKNAIMQYAMERAREHAARTQKAKPVSKNNVDKNGVDLNVLAKGGITKWKKWEVYVHTSEVSRILPTGKWHFRDANGYRVFIKTMKREIAQEFVNEYYGKGKYNVSAACLD